MSCCVGCELFTAWMDKNLESEGSVVLPLLDNPEFVEHDVARDLEFIREGSKLSVRVQFFGSKFSLWNLISSYIKTWFENHIINS